MEVDWQPHLGAEEDGNFTFTEGNDQGIIIIIIPSTKPGGEYFKTGNTDGGRAYLPLNKKEVFSEEEDIERNSGQRAEIGFDTCVFAGKTVGKVYRVPCSIFEQNLKGLLYKGTTFLYSLSEQHQF